MTTRNCVLLHPSPGAAEDEQSTQPAEETTHIPSYKSSPGSHNQIRILGDTTRGGLKLADSPPLSQTPGNPPIAVGSRSPVRSHPTVSPDAPDYAPDLMGVSPNPARGRGWS